MNISYSSHPDDDEKKKGLLNDINGDNTSNNDEDGKDIGLDDMIPDVTIRSAAAIEPPVPNPLEKPDRAKKLTYEEMRKESLPTYSDSLGSIRKEYLETHLAIKLGKEKDRKKNNRDSICQTDPINTGDE